LNRRTLAVLLGLGAILNFVSCGGSSKKPTTSGLKERVMASQSVTSTSAFGDLRFINGINDTLPGVAPLSAGLAPGLMATSPTRNILITFDARSNSVFAFNTVTEAGFGQVTLPGPTTSMVVPTAATIGYAAVPSAQVTGFTGVGAVDVMNLAGAITTTILIPNAQTVIANPAGSQIIVFNSNSSSQSDYITVVNPGVAVPPVDTSCQQALQGQNNSVCTIVHGFDQPVYGIINGNTAYILNCGPQCGGTTASVAIFDLGSLTITNTIPVDAATWALLNGSTLYVVGTSPTNFACTGQTTAATTCGRLDIIDLNLGTVTNSVAITDGTHDRMDLGSNNQLFIGSHDCTNIGNVNFPNGEVRGCLTIYNLTNGSVVIPPDNGDVTGIQGFSSRYVEYVAQGGNLRVYDTTRDVLLVNDFLPAGTINIVGYVTDIKAIDFF